MISNFLKEVVALEHDVLYAIGEALIDFIPDKSGCKFKDIDSFMPALGGAPANVCGAFARLSGKSEIITQLGNDSFGRKIFEELKEFGIGTSHISFTEDANTCLAFVSLSDDGNREFSFYRNPSADMLLCGKQIKKEWFDNAFALHFCSVSLCDAPIKEAHNVAIEYAKKSGAIISFDPNLRFPLWKDKEKLKSTVNEYIPLCDVLKISDDELEFISGENDIQAALPGFFKSGVKLVLFTCGCDGAWAFTENSSAFAKAEKVDAVDTTGAGDAFIGSFLYCLFNDKINVYSIETLQSESLERYLKFANRYSGKSVMRKGAIPSYPTIDEL